MSELPSIANMAYASTSNNASDFYTRAIGAAPRQSGLDNSFVGAIFAQSPNPEQPMTKRRLVQVFIADVNDSVPLEHTLLYRGEPKLTDLDDQELFFELDIRTLLVEHNAKRVTWKDKEASGDKDVMLEPARIRELKMTVVTIASF